MGLEGSQILGPVLGHPGNQYSWRSSTSLAGLLVLLMRGTPQAPLDAALSFLCPLVYCMILLSCSGSWKAKARKLIVSNQPLPPAHATGSPEVQEHREASHLEQREKYSLNLCLNELSCNHLHINHLRWLRCRGLVQVCVATRKLSWDIWEPSSLNPGFREEL